VQRRQKIKSIKEIEEKVNRILEKYYVDKECVFPIDIEGIIEFHLNLTFYIERGISKQFGGETYLALNANRIVVEEDLFVNEKRRSRLCFSLAHEVGHYILHRSLFSSVSSIEDYIDQLNSIDDRTYNVIEREANIFAGFLLMPRELMDDYISTINKPLESWDLKDTAKVIYHFTKIVPCSKTTACIQCKDHALTSEYPNIQTHLQTIINLSKPR
jgi:Zn-dependent peptidase ImmA (M78 family)